MWCLRSESSTLAADGHVVSRGASWSGWPGIRFRVLRGRGEGEQLGRIAVRFPSFGGATVCGVVTLMLVAAVLVQPWEDRAVVSWPGARSRVAGRAADLRSCRLDTVPFLCGVRQSPRPRTWPLGICGWRALAVAGQGPGWPCVWDGGHARYFVRGVGGLVVSRVWRVWCVAAGSSGAGSTGVSRWRIQQEQHCRVKTSPVEHHVGGVLVPGRDLAARSARRAVGWDAGVGNAFTGGEALPVVLGGQEPGGIGCRWNRPTSCRRPAPQTGRAGGSRAGRASPWHGELLPSPASVVRCPSCSDNGQRSPLHHMFDFRTSIVRHALTPHLHVSPAMRKSPPLTAVSYRRPSAESTNA